jgi:hypothetical protein
MLEEKLKSAIGVGDDLLTMRIEDIYSPTRYKYSQIL